MKLVRSDAPEVAGGIASARAWANRKSYTLGFSCTANLLALLIALALSIGVSVRAAARLSVPVLLALNGYVLWRAQASHRRWVTVGCGGWLYVRLFVRRGRGRCEVKEPDVLTLEASEITSISARTIEVFLYGPKPRTVEWLVIKVAQSVAEDISRHIRPLLTPTEPDKAVLVADEEGRLTIEWKWWRPALGGIPPASRAGMSIRCHSLRRTFRAGFEWDLERDFAELGPATTPATPSGDAARVRLRMQAAARPA